MKDLLSICTRDNITLMLSIIGSVGTVSGWIYFWVTNHRNFSLSINGYSYVKNSGLLIHVSFSNKSKLSLSITNICLTFINLQYPCSQIPKKVLETTRRHGNELLSHNEYYSMEMPINLSALSGKSGYIYFPLDGEISLDLPSSQEFVVCTNRGKPLKMSLSLQKHLD